MFRRFAVFIVLALLVIGLAGCHNKRVTNPLANVGSKQPDKVLFDRAIDQMKHNHFDQARLILQTLINTYPDSEYLARAKLAVGDSWYAEGGSAALAQAENEYKDFITFFPNMPEAAEAQLKVANIHYRQMEKPDRDFTHAVRAEEEYRQLILQFPDSKLVPQAKERLLEVQEVLAEREFRIGRFYYLRESWPAGIARLESLVDTYPLYSGADEALYLLGSAYEREADQIRATKMNEVAKGSLIRTFEDQAAAAYARIISRYPVMQRAEEARKRLEALHRPVPTPTAEAIAQNKAEEASRGELGHFSKFMMNLHRRPDTSMAAKVGEPSLVDPKQTGAPEVVRDNATALATAAAAAFGGGESKVTVETVGKGAPPPNQPIPRSDTAAAPSPDKAQPEKDAGIPELQPITPGNQVSATPVAPAPAPQQVNEAQGAQPAPGANTAAAAGPDAKADSASAADSKDAKDSSSSKHKKKKGLKKLVPF